MTNLHKEKDIKIFSKEINECKGKTVIELFGMCEDKAKQNLATVGMASYSYFQIKVEDLTNIEKIKLFIALAIEHNEYAVCIDQYDFNGISKEYISSYFLNIKKITRNHKLKFIILLCQDAYAKYVFPNCELYLSFQNDNYILYKQDELNDINILTREISLRKGTMEDYKTLEKYHYAKTPDVEIDYVYCATYENIIAAVTIYVSPIKEIGIEVIKQNPIFEFILHNIICCTRIVVNPQFRGLGIAKELIGYSIQNIPCKIIECRSSMLNNTEVMKKWGGFEVNRDYRKYTPYYDALVEYLNELEIGFDSLNQNFINEISQEKLGKLKMLMLNRLKELDTYQWMYYEQLVKMVATFSNDEFECAQKLYVDSYQASYQNIPVGELLYMCKKWDSMACVYKCTKD